MLNRISDMATAMWSLAGEGAKSVVFALVVATGLSVFAKQAYNPPTSEDGIEVRHAIKLPTIDGKLDETIYDNVEWSASFMSLGKESTTVNALWLNAADKFAKLQTRFALITDKKDLVVAVKAPVPAGEKANGSGKFGGKDDFVEFFMLSDDGSFFQILVDAGGHPHTLKYAGEGSVGVKTELAGLQTAAVVEGVTYTVEIRVPLSSLGIAPPKTGAVLRGNVTREGSTNGGLSTWAPVGTTFNNPDRFGEFYWVDRVTTYRERMKARESAAKKLAATGKTMVFWKGNHYHSYKPTLSPDPDKLLNGVHSGEIPRGSRAIAPFMASNLGDKEFVGTFEVKGELAKLIRFREVGFIELKGGILVPDPIWDIPEKRVLRIRPHETVLVWFDVDSRDLKTGKYKSEVTLHPARSGFNYEKFDFELEVSDIAIADKDPIAWVWGMRDNVMRDHFRDYGFLGFGVLPNAALPKDASGFAELDATVKEAEDLGVPRKEQFRMFWTDFQKESHWTRYNKDGKWYYFGSDYWKAEFSRRLLLLRDHMKELGFDYSQWALYTIDEPYGDPEKEGTTAWYAIEGAKLVKSIDPKIRIWTNPTNLGGGSFRSLDDGYQHHYLKWYDALCPNFERIIPYPKVCQEYRASGKEIWTYSVRSKGGTPDSYRGDCWSLAREGFLGPATFYDLYRNSGDGYDSYDGGRVTVDYSSIYRDPRTQGFSVSRRMEAWYEGLVDMRLIHLTERLAQTDAERAKVKEIIMLGAYRKRTFQYLRSELMTFCKTLKARRDGENKKQNRKEAK